MPNTPPVHGKDDETFQLLPWKHGFCHRTTHHTLLDEDMPLTNHVNSLA
jgi:hypothetical protein